MNDRGLTRRYGALEADERFRLELRAAARDDHQEVDRLVRSCPRRDYRMNDAAFVDRAQAARLLAALVIGEVRPPLAQVAVMRASTEVTRQAMVLAIEAAAEAFDRPLSDQESAEAHEAAGANALIDGIEEAIAMQLATAAAAWQAFEVVCREEMAVDPKTVISASFGREFLALHEPELDQVATAEADADAVARWRELFGERWRAAAR